MNIDLKGKTAYVTGGGGAIGGCTAKVLAACGASVLLIDRSEAALDRAAAELRQQSPGVSVKTMELDITDSKAVSAKLGQPEGGADPCDILVNGAGFSRDGYMLKMTDDDWDAVHQVILKGAFHCTKAVLPHMMKSRWGRIINISSMAYVGNKGQTNYSAAKAGLNAMTRALAQEAGPFNITVNAVAPGLVATPRLRARDDWAVLEKRLLAQTPLGRLCVEEDVAKAILFFCSNLADAVSGQVLHVSGGA